MGKFWSILFLLVPVLGTVSIVWAALELPPFEKHWLPPDVSEHGAAIDHIFNVILWITGVIFVGTGLALAWFMWKYGEHSKTADVNFVHGNHKLEAAWSIVPGLILVFISIYQMQAWEDQKMNRPTELVDGVEVLTPPLARVIARQFGWQFQYAGNDRLLDTDDDVFSESVLVVPKEEEIVLQIESIDVLHSFFIPNLRIKQDIVPGMQQFCWFKALKTGDYDIACTELCGWGHYKMQARLTVLERADYDAWFESAAAENQKADFNE